MARIAEAEIERLKKEISLERLATAKGVKLKAHGKDLVGLCPFHDDREPSLVITPEKNLWHCLGACQTGGSVIDWVMRAEGVSFRCAVELLRTDAVSSSPAPRKSTVKLPPLASESADDDVLMRQVVGFYHATLKESPEALAYLEQRGLKSAELIERFQIGFANRTLSYRLPSKERVDGAELRGRLQRLGILRESGHEHMNGSIVVPIFDEAGRVVEMYGRKITPRLREGTPLHTYLPGPHRGVWNVSALEQSQEVILCEALIDAMTFWCAGYRNVTASYGVEGFTDDHLAAFRKYGTRRVYIAYDRDDAGERAAVKLAERLMAEGMECYRVLFPKGMDANEYGQKMTPAAQAFGVVVRNAQWMGKGEAPSMTSPSPAVHAAPSEIVVVGETATLVADADGVVVREIPNELPTAAESIEEPTPATNVEPFPPLVAAPPAAPSHEVIANDDEVLVRSGDRSWRVRGLAKNARPETLRVNVRVAREGGGFHVDTLELYSARQRAVYVSMAAVELGVEERVVKKDLGEILLKLEELAESKKTTAKEEAKRPPLTEQEQRAALSLLRDPKLLERVLEDFERCGVVGERTNKLVGYLAATSRKLDQPLAVVIQSSSAAGKSSLMDAVLNLMPEEERTQYSAMTGQALYYLGDADLRHKVLAIVEEEGASRASYALKLLQSEGELTIASTGKDPATGRLVTQEYRVEGPVMIFLTTTAIEVDEELLNRCIVLSVDEGREQTRAIHAQQRASQTIEGMLARRDRDAVVKLHRDAQRMLRPVLVSNPFAGELRFLDHATRTRRDHMKYLTLIRTIALLHQYQRPVKHVEHGGETIEYIEVTREDIAIANHLCREVLGRSLDELPPQTRRLLGHVEEMVRAECTKAGIEREDYRFSRRDVREWTKWGQTQLRIHLGRLIEMEYVLVHRGKQGQGYVYELAYASDSPLASGLFDDGSTTPTSRGSEGDFAGSSRGDVGGAAGPLRGDEPRTEARENGHIVTLAAASGENTHRGRRAMNGASYDGTRSPAPRVAIARGR